MSSKTVKSYSVEYGHFSSLRSKRFRAVSRVKDRATKTARKMARVSGVSFLARPKPRISFLGLSLLRNSTGNACYAGYFSTSEIGATQLCAPKSPFLCVNRSHMWYGFYAGVKAIRYGVHIALITTIVSSRDFVFTDAILSYFCSPNIRRIHPTYSYYALVCFKEE